MGRLTSALGAVVAAVLLSTAAFAVELVGWVSAASVSVRAIGVAAARNPTTLLLFPIMLGYARKLRRRANNLVGGRANPTYAAMGLLFVLSSAALAVEPTEMLKDPAQEARARALSAELRCLVCQNQSIDDSNAPLAKDLRILVREQIKSGKSDEAVMAYIVERYGEFVLLRPRLNLNTLLLWLAPLLLLGGAGYAVHRAMRRKEPVPVEAPLSAEEQRRLDDLLKREG